MYLCISFPKLAAASSVSAGASTARAGNLMVQGHEQRAIAASPERVFDWLLDPANCHRHQPDRLSVFHKAGWATDSTGPGAGATREVTGIGF
jgi:hypothetical protein